VPGPLREHVRGRVVWCPGRLVGALAREGVEHVDHSDQPPCQGDRVPGQTLRVAGAVPAFVVGEGDLLGETQELGLPAGQDVCAGSRVTLDGVELGGCQRTGLEQHGVGDADLADVVQRGRFAEQAGLGGGKAKGRCEPVCGRADTDSVIGGDVVAVLAHQRQPLHQSGVGQLELLGAGLHLRLQLLVLLAEADVEHPGCQEVGDAQRGLGDVDGLGEEVVRAQGQGGPPGAGRGVGGDYEPGDQVGGGDGGLESPEHLEAVHVGHVQVEHDQVRVEVVEVVEHPSWVGGQDDVPVPLAGQHAVDQVEVRLLVVHDHDP